MFEQFTLDPASLSTTNSESAPPGAGLSDALEKNKLELAHGLVQHSAFSVSCCIITPEFAEMSNLDCMAWGPRREPPKRSEFTICHTKRNLN